MYKQIQIIVSYINKFLDGLNYVAMVGIYNIVWSPFYIVNLLLPHTKLGWKCRFKIRTVLSKVTFFLSRFNGFGLVLLFLLNDMITFMQDYGHFLEEDV